MAETFGVQAFVTELRRALEREATAERAQQEKRYLKSELAFLGATMPTVRKTARAFSREHPTLSRDELRALVDALWQTRVHELRTVAIALLELREGLLRAKDAPWLITFVREAKTWAHVDFLAIKVIGPLVARQTSVEKQLSRWAKDPDFWVRRTALLALHDPLLQGRGDFARFAELAVPMLGESEFFIRKAIGWVLRSTAKRTPERTTRFVEEHALELSGLSFREATRGLPAKTRERLEKKRAQLRS